MNTTPEAPTPATSVAPIVPTPLSLKIPKDNKVKIFFRKFVSTKRRRIATLIGMFVVVMLLVILIVVLALNKPAKVVDPQAVINPVLPAPVKDKSVLDAYDLIYLNNDKQLAATSADGKKSVVITNVDGIVTDFKVSPNKKKIAYLVSESDYKTKVNSEGLDLSKFAFDPVPTQLFEYDLYTGKNKLIWQMTNLQLIKTGNKDYFPVSYVTNYSYNPYTSYPVSYTYPVPIEIPQELYSSLPIDIEYDLFSKEPRLIAYKDTDDRLVYYADQNLLVTNSDSSSTLVKDYANAGPNSYLACRPYSGQWKATILAISDGCYESLTYEFFQLNGTKLDQFDTKGINFISQPGGTNSPVGLTSTDVIVHDMEITGFENNEMQSTNTLQLRKIADLGSFTSATLPGNEFVTTSLDENSVNQGDKNFYFLTYQNLDNQGMFQYNVYNLDLAKNTVSKVSTINLSPVYGYFTAVSFNSDFTKVVVQGTYAKGDSSKVNAFGVFDLTTGKYAETNGSLTKDAYGTKSPFKVDWLK